MTSALNVIPENQDLNTGVHHTPAVAEGLANILADTYRLMFKTHAYHWNVEGPLFFSVHKLTQTQYENLFEAADELAERIRALGRLAPMNLQDMVQGSVVKDLTDAPSGGEMCENLANDHEHMAQRLHALITVAGASNDPVTEDLATQRSAFHEQAVWMLRAIAKQS